MANRVVLAQAKVDTRSDEISAIPELLRMLEVSGCIVTIDAMGCQKEIAQLLIERGVERRVGNETCAPSVSNPTPQTSSLTQKGYQRGHYV